MDLRAHLLPNVACAALYPSKCLRGLCIVAALAFGGLSAACDGSEQNTSTDGASTGSSGMSGTSALPGGSGTTSSGAAADSSSSGDQSENSSSDATSNEQTSSDTTSSSETEQGPFPDEPTIVVQDNATLCGAVRWTLRDFKKAFKTKNQLVLRGGSYPAKAFEFHGKIRYQDREADVASEPLDVAIDSAGKSHALAKLDKGEIRVAKEHPVKMTMRLTAAQDGDFNTFKLDDFSKFTSELEYKKVSLGSETALDIFDGYKGAVYGPCETPDIRSEVFRFELANDGWVEFEAKTRLPKFDKHAQHGLTVRAHGEVNGVAFDVNQWEDLLYGSTEFSEFPRPPSLGVRFPEEKGICGIGFKTDFSDEEEPYKAQVLDCELEVKARPEIRLAKYPDRFMIP